MTTTRARRHAERVRAELAVAKSCNRQGRLAGDAFLAALAENELTAVVAARVERHRGASACRQDARHVRLRGRADGLEIQVMALASGDAWLAKGADILLFGPPGGGKSHLSAALEARPDREWMRVMFAAPLISCNG